MKAVITLLAIAVLLTGCATAKNWSATGGSRADGVVRLSYEVGAFEKPMLNESEAVSLATSRCQTWGYSGAEAFGGVTRVCNMPGGGFGGCQGWLITKEFQCTGNATPPAN